MLFGGFKAPGPQVGASSQRKGRCLNVLGVAIVAAPPDKLHQPAVLMEQAERERGINKHSLLSNKSIKDGVP